MPSIIATPDTIKWTDKVTAWATLAAVAAALAIAIAGTIRDGMIRKKDREVANEQLLEEREFSEARLAKETEEYERRLIEDRAHIERQRQADRNIDLLIRVAEAYANASRSYGVYKDPAEDPTAGDRTRARIILAALPDDVAVLIRDRVRAPESVSTNGSARRKLEHLNEFQKQGGRPALSDAALMAYEMDMDMRRLASGDTRLMIDNRFWWDSANQLH